MNEGVFPIPSSTPSGEKTLASGEVNGVFNFDIDLSKWSKIAGLRFLMWDVVVQTGGGSWYARFGAERGNYRAGASDYFSMLVGVDVGGAAAGNVFGANNAATLFTTCSDTYPATLVMELPAINPAPFPFVGPRFNIFHRATGLNGGLSYQYAQGSTLVTFPANYMQIGNTSGTMRGKWKLLGPDTTI